MQITTNFALSCRLRYVYSKDSRLSIKRGRKNFVIEVGPNTESALTEREAWVLFNSMEPDWFPELHKQGIAMEGVAQRGRLMLEHSDTELARMLTEMHQVLRTAFMSLAGAMGAPVLSRHVAPVQLTFSRQFSAWVVKARVHLAHFKDPVPLRCEFTPSPLHAIGWQLDVALPSHSLAEYERNQWLIDGALPMLGQTDFMLCPVTSGASLLI